jgi:ATP-dependent Clp protease ATP-binding subunit ClpA
MPLFTRELEKTLRRALSEANNLNHEYANLEHLLLSLTDDPQARELLLSCGCNIVHLQKTVRTYINTELKNLISDVNEEAKATNGFQRVVQRAAFHVQSSGTEEVSGANVLVAIFAETDTHAAYFLKEEDITRYDAVSYMASKITEKEDPIELVEEGIKGVADSAPQFSSKSGRLSYVDRAALGDLRERKSAVDSRLKNLISICASRSKRTTTT